MALAGGQTPRPIYAALATRRGPRLLPWEHVEVFFTDERAVPPGDPQSNYGMVRETLLSAVGIPEGQVHRMKGESPDLATAAREYDAVLPPRLDILLLGMGADGHTASLFPGDPAVSEREHRVVSVSTASAGPRLTITPPVVALARRVAVVAHGPEKADAAVRALEGPFNPSEVPVQLALGGTWFLDRAAASRLSQASAPR